MIGLFKNPLSRLAAALLLCCTFATQAGERVTYYHNDALGSPVASSDESGNLVWSEEYSPHGGRQLREANDGNDIWYTGKQEEVGMGVQYFHARWYDPDLGAFLSRDPPGFQPGNVHSFNHYVYSNNNPYRYVDPNGESPVEIITEVLPAAGRSYGALAAYAVGKATGDVHLQNAAMDGMRQQTTDNAIAIASIMGPPGSGKALRGAKGLTTPKKYFGNKTKPEVKDALEKKYGPPKSSREHADTYYNDKTKRSYNVHEEPGHNGGKPHVDIRRRGGYEERKYDLKETK